MSAAARIGGAPHAAAPHTGEPHAGELPAALHAGAPHAAPADRPLKIAMIGAKGIPATVGGVERIVEELSARLAGRGHDVTVYCRRGYTGALSDDSWRGTRLRWTPSLPGKYTDTMSHAVTSLADALGRGFDLLHIHSLGNAPAVMMAWLAGARVLFHIHGQEWKGGKWGRGARAFFKACERPGIDFARRTVVNTMASRDYYRAAYGAHTVYIPNAVEVPPHRPTGVLDALGVTPRNYLLFVGRLVPEKGCHLLLEAHRRLATAPPVVVVGEPAHSDDYAAELRRVAGPGVIFAGRRLGDELTDLYARSLLVVNPTYRDAVSLVLLEAMGQGAAVVTSDIPEMIEGLGGAGVHFHAGDAADLAAALAALLAAPDRIEALREPARRRVQTEYAWPAAVDRFEEVYRDLMKGAD